MIISLLFYWYARTKVRVLGTWFGGPWSVYHCVVLKVKVNTCKWKKKIFQYLLFSDPEKN